LSSQEVIPSFGRREASFLSGINWVQATGGGVAASNLYVGYRTGGTWTSLAVPRRQAKTRQSKAAAILANYLLYGLPEYGVVLEAHY